MEVLGGLLPDPMVLKTITSGWNLLGTSEEITNISAVFDSTYQVYAVGANKTTFENIKDMNRTIKANSGFWVYKGSEQLLP